MRALVAALVLVGLVRSEPVSSEIDAMMYLQRYGYMNTTAAGTAALVSHESIFNSIRDFQRFAGLEETGSLNNETITMMNTPRCGVRDTVGHGSTARRKKRFDLQGSKWRVTDLTFKISKYPTRLKDQVKIDKEISKAFKVWSDVSPLNFITKKNGRVHLDVRFESREHGDGDPFDGPGRTLAHAFFPQFGGDAHFDDEEKWTIDAYQGTNLFQVAAHEFGHSLGLSHSDVRSSLMAPFYRGYERSFKLDKDDIQAIQALYGKREEQRPVSSQPPTSKPASSPPKVPVSPDTSGSPDLCQDSQIDAATKTADGNTYVFKGNFYWKIMEKGIADGYPRKISDDWNGLPGNIDAALTWSDGKTFFFKGSQYWRYRDQNRDSGYPKNIQVGFEGIPDSVDAAFLWSGNGKTYFFKGDQYWRFDSRSTPPVSSRYPRPISNWDGIPGGLNAAFQWNNGRTYFFKGRNYYRFNDRTFSIDEADPAFPRSTSIWWFDCRPISRKLPPQSSGLKSEDRDAVFVGSISEDVLLIQPGGEGTEEIKFNNHSSSSKLVSTGFLAAFVLLVMFL